MSFCTSSFFCPRLIDYFLIVGPQKPYKNQEGKFCSTILKRFPPLEYNDFTLPPETVYFCQPDGHSVINLFTKETSSFVFTLTDKDVNRVRYGVCLTFCVSLRLENGRTLNNDLNTPKSQSMISFCVISHHPIFSGFRRCLSTLKEMIDCISGFGRLQSGKLWNPLSFWELFLYGESIQEEISNAELQIACQLEKWILRLVSIPAAVPGYTYVKLKLLPENIEDPLIFALPDKSRLSLVDFPFYLPMELLGIDNCLQVIMAILLEQKVILKSRDYNALTMSVLALTAMLYPLQYMFPIIPLLPTALPGAEQILSSPTPFLIGIPSSFMEEKGQQLSMADMCLVDLDSGQITYGAAVSPLPEFPQQEIKDLRSKLLRALEIMKKGASSSPTTIVEGLNKSHINGCENASLESSIFDVDVVDIATRVAMVRFFNSPSILADFTEHTRTLRLFPRPIVTFQYISFMRSRPTLSSFTQKLAKTQAVEYLSEWCLYPENEVFQRIHAGIFDPKLIGDKPKWFCHDLVMTEFKAFDDSDMCLIHLGCCKNKNPWAIENVKLEPWLSDKADLRLINSSSDTSSYTRTFLVNYREFYSPPMSVEETVAFARSVRESETISANPKKRSSPSKVIPPSQQPAETSASDGNVTSRIHNECSSLSSSKRASTIADSDEVYDDIFSSTSSQDDDESDQDDSDIWDLKSSSILSGENTETKGLESTYNNTNLTQNSQDNEIGTAAVLESSISALNSNQFSNQEAVERQVSANSMSKTPLSTVSQEKRKMGKSEEDDMEEVTVGAHILSNLSDVFSGAANHASNAFSGIRAPRNLVAKSKQLLKMPTTLVTNLGLDTGETRADVGKSRGKESTQTTASYRTFEGFFKRPQFLNSQATRKQKNINMFEQTSFDTTSTHKQELLQSITQTIWAGEKVGLITKNDARILMEDERYRNYLLIKLLAESHDFIYDVDSHIPDVALQDTTMFRNLVWLARVIIVGYERNWLNRGVNSVGSVFSLLELAHTHFWDQGATLEQNMLSAKSKNHGPASLQGSRENLVSRKAEKNTFGNLTGWIKTTANEIRRSSLVSGSPSESPSRSSSNATTEVDGKRLPISLTTSPISPRSANKLSHTSLNDGEEKIMFGREVIVDEANEPKSKISGSNRFRHGECLRCMNHSESSRQPNQNQETRIRHQPRYYIFETLVSSKDRSKIWDQNQFWEDAFLDTVACERDLLGLDHSPTEMIERYNKLSNPEKKLLDLKEDRILAVLLHNLIAFMVLMRVSRQDLLGIAYRLLGRCRLGSHFSHQISNLIENLPKLEGNSIDLLPAASRCLYRQAFVVVVLNVKQKNSKASIFEIYDNAYLVRDLSGEVVRKQHLDNILAAVIFPKSRIFLLVEVDGEAVTLLQLHTRKVKTLYFTIQVAMERHLFVTKRIASPIEFCSNVLTDKDKIQKRLESFGHAEGIAFSRPKNNQG